MSSVRRSNGRRKVEMKKMTKESNLQVTFSKRRIGLFKKASELSTLCGAEVALIIFSPGDKVFSFGHPNVNALIHRYLMGGPPQTSSTMRFVEAHRSANVRDLNARFTEITNQLDAEMRRAEELNQLLKAKRVDETSIPQLEQFKVVLEELKWSVTRQSHILNAVNSVPPVMLQPSVLQNFLLNNVREFDGNMMNRYGFNNMGGYGPDGFY